MLDEINIRFEYQLLRSLSYGHRPLPLRFTFH